MVNLNTPVKVPQDFNKVESSLLYDDKENVIASLHRFSKEQKFELVKRINDYPKLVKAICELIRTRDIIDADLDSVESHNEAYSNAYRELKGIAHNISRKTISEYK